MNGRKKLRDLERRLNPLSTQHERKQVLKEVYACLVNGEVYDWKGEEICNLIELMSNNNLNSEAHKLILSCNSVAKTDPTEDYEEMIKKMPEYFARKVDSGAILSRGEMIMLGSSSKDVVFNRLFNHVTSFGIGVLPSYASSTMRELEDELLSTMQSYEEVKDSEELRKKLGKKANIIQLKQFGNDFYTYEERERGAEMPTGGIEFKINKATPIEGPRFMVTRVHGYYGILRYLIEEMARIAPENANAFLDGTGIIRSVKYRGMWSPIVSGNVLRPISQPEGDYHIVPVKFFNVEVDRSKKYSSEMKEVAWADNGKPYAWREVVKPRGKSAEVSKSENVLIVG